MQPERLRWLTLGFSLLRSKWMMTRMTTLRSRTGREVARSSSFTFFYLFSGFSFLAQYILFADVCNRLFFCLDVLLHLFIFMDLYL